MIDRSLIVLSITSMMDGKFFKMNELFNICGNVALPITFGKSQSQQIYAYTYGSSTLAVS
jgi:hypothetical protein